MKIYKASSDLLKSNLQNEADFVQSSPDQIIMENNFGLQLIFSLCESFSSELTRVLKSFKYLALF